jgi:glutathione peroxidase
MFSKIEVNGDNAHPLYKYLKAEAGGVLTDAIKWNFTKFLVARDGQVLDRFAPFTNPGEIEEDIAKALQE